MDVQRRTQAERSAATRGALVAAARTRFAARGYAAVSTPEIAEAAGVTRGAMYHQFADKAALFAAVAEAVEAGVTQRMADDVLAAGHPDPLSALHGAVDAWLARARSRRSARSCCSTRPSSWAGRGSGTSRSTTAWG